MPVIDFRVTGREPYAGGASFGDAGSYEQIDGVVAFAVDPGNDANRLIVDLDKAPRDSAGRVRFEADFSIVVPAGPVSGSGKVLVELPNRGRRRVVNIVNRGPAEPDTRTPDPGDGFLFRHGFSIASIGWQHDVYRDDALMGLKAPVALDDGAPIRGQTITEIRPNHVERTRLLANRIHRPYPVVDLEEAGAQLTVRDYEDGEARLIPRSAWRFARETADGVVPSNEHIYFEDGFQPGRYYYVTYVTEGAPVVGAGLLAVRDIALFLRDGHPALGAAADGFNWIYGFGVSQTGRMLREFLYLGLNSGEDGRAAYDGLMPHVAGARRGSFNHRFAQPSEQAIPGFGHRFPFADDELTDPNTAETDGLLNRPRAQETMPKVIYTNSSAEYWRGDGALMHVDPSGAHDLPAPPETRIYHFAGTQHGAGKLPQATVSGSDGSVARYGFNVVDYSPLLRAVIVNLDRWVSDGVAPPSSRHPRIDDGTAVTRDAVLEVFDRLPGMITPDRERLWVIRAVDLGAGEPAGIGRWPALEGDAYPCLVSAVDDDGNEVAGIRVPDVAVPVGTHAGWNVRAPETGSPEQQIPMQGFTDFFSAGADGRNAVGDPRPAIEERYADRDEYLRRARGVAVDLVSSGYALSEDIELMVDNAAGRWDVAMASAVSDEAGFVRGGMRTI
ncbi:MAG: hypothetical protein IIC93_04360 [Chloroflexi bacterium]|nr:hypothetical protein [Chloroflexota bacterium]